MRFYLDTEFYDQGHEHPVQLINIGLVREDGMEYYAEIDGVDYTALDDWLQKNVVTHLTGPRRSRAQVMRDIKLFVGQEIPEFWGYYADYDWVLFCQLFGGMLNLPPGWPHLCLDLSQAAIHRGLQKSSFPVQAPGTEHHALYDARWNKSLFNCIHSQLAG